MNITLVGTYISLKNVSPGEIHQILAVNISSLRIGFPFKKILKKESRHTYFLNRRNEKKIKSLILRGYWSSICL